MSETKITASKNGPYVVSGAVTLEGMHGEEIETKENFALCRCGGSKNKPFCDGTHKEIGFKSENVGAEH